MNNKNKFLVMGAVIGTTALMVGSVFVSQDPFFKKTAGTDGDWNHYSAVAATLDSKGIKEYWVNCNTHEHQFTAPASGTIVDQGAPDQAFINSLASNDDRLVDRYLKGFDFDDGVNPYITIKSGFETLQVVDGEGVGGSKALRASRSTAGDSFLRISKEYLDAVFANPNVKSLSFAAKAHNPTNNFRHISVDASYVNNNSNIISCFEINNANWGITTTYKTFYLTRGVYSQMNMSDGNLDWFVKFGAGSVLPQYLYLDDIKICTTDYYDASFNGLENGYWSGTELKNPVLNERSFYGTGQLENAGFSYDMKTEGVRSFKFDKLSNYSAYYLGTSMNSSLGENDYITFDMYGTTALNCSNGAINSGQNHQFLASNFPANKWVTLTMPKSEITTDGRFLILQGSATGTYYIDNIRVNSAKYSFESNTRTSIFGDYANASHYDIADSSASNTLRDGTKDYVAIAEWGGWTEIKVVEGIASEGAYSLKLTTTAGNKPIRIMPAWYDRMDDDSTFSFDIYTENMTFTGICASVPKGAWTTITITKAQFGANYRLFDGSTNKFSAGTMYLDNFVLVL